MFYLYVADMLVNKYSHILKQVLNTLLSFEHVVKMHSSLCLDNILYTKNIYIALILYNSISHKGHVQSSAIFINLRAHLVQKI
jgi:hypothetical protein